jgi:hypothetical protein
MGLISRNGGNRHPALSKKAQGREALNGSLANTDYDKNTNKSKKSEAILNGRRLLVLTFWL